MKRLGWLPIVRTPVTNVSSPVTSGVGLPPSSQTRADTRTTSWPRLRSSRSRSRHASTTALWDMRSTLNVPPGESAAAPPHHVF